ncbi:phage tail tape measure C-terminal domain-containing protein [Pseudomonas sp. NBRC 111129]|uniref:phage tail tape measure C-terminal domain-containing protein n=1 Tax=Pseudomonas sp. NBRC 111129 TaxID=1661044 RepID=UPI0006D47FF4|nr:phage tail tape measure C-terminal domain-containing protein [Pseudomonas sp. NBRC 111129]
MASKSLGILTLDVIAKTGSFVEGMDRAGRSSEKWRKDVEKNAKAVGSAVGATIAAGVAALAAFTVSTVNAANEISRLASVSGASTNEFQRYAAGAKAVGIESDKFADILKDVNDKVGDFLLNGGGELQDFFKTIAPKVGVTADQFRNLSGPQALQLFATSLEKAGLSQAEMTQQMESLANDATLLLPLLRDNGAGFDVLGDAAEKAGAIMDQKTIAATKNLAAAGWLAEQSMAGIKNQLAAALMPTLSDYSGILSDLGQDTETMTALSNGLRMVMDFGAKTALALAYAVELTGRSISGLVTIVGGSFEGVDMSKPLEAIDKIKENSSRLAGEVGKDLDKLDERYNKLWAKVDQAGSSGQASGKIKEIADALALVNKEGARGTFKAPTTEAQAAAKAAETAAKKLQSQFDTAEEGYKRQIALINTSTDKRKNATEVDKLAFELEQGKLQGLSEAQGKRLEGLAAELDAKKALLKADQDAKKLAALQANLDEDNRTAKEGLDMELAGAGQGDKSRERFRALLAIEQDYNKQRREMYKEYKEALLAEDPDAEVNYQKETDALDKALKLRLEHQRNFYEQQDEMQGDWLVGVSDAWQNYVDIAADFSEQAGAATESILSDATSSISGSLQGIIKGTESVGDAFGNLAATMANSVLGALTDIAAKWIVVQALKMAGITAETTATVASEATKTTAKLATDAASTASSLTATATVASAQVAAAGTTMTAWLPAALVASVGSFGAAAIVGGTALLAAFALIKGFSGGGYTGAGGVNEPAGVVHKGEVVWSQADIKRFGGVSAVEALRKGKAAPMGDLRSAGDSWELPPQVASSSDAAGSNTNVNQVFNVNGDVSPQTVAMIEQMGMRVAKSFQQDINRNGPMMQSIRKKI